ncbi:mannosyl-3-phosphoglycerate phosphatase [Notoacmeibacter sp. MSK16QG-6]|uniref:HAD-IIB family hydrolase n=1 Tax=Notoacmeibacter sp. MSK16QG-6 TaxID=2957982 RepID=UPI00209D3F55|nr:HAD-IIB family hydrolase [Notoacmeibacter sp. MSK16QG-6]MCP1199721.1 HAD-IIB family hydrolase [Notoacmeibacter sp. MSK16QG-6]
MIVFSDLDGTLLDHSSYDFAPALPAIRRLQDAGIPIVPATSKTAAEVAPLMKRIGLEGPAIVENGGGVINGSDTAYRSGDYLIVRERLDQLPPAMRDRFKGFGDMGVDGIAKATGLPLDAAKLAGERQFTEPGLFDGTPDELSDFLDALHSLGISAKKGGRFLTLANGRHSKADKMSMVCKEIDAEPPIVALGDAPNDRAMLEAANIAIVVRNPDHGGIDVAETAQRRVIQTTQPGPMGWNEAIQAILDEYGY